MAFRDAVFTAYTILFSIFISVSCSCPKGYYSSPCTPCPVSTYKDFVGYAASCKPCPSNSGHSLRGSISVQNCKCLTGYDGQPEYGRPCQIRHCVRLATPHNGAFVGVCNTEYSSECRMACNEGYEAVGSVERKCIISPANHAIWTGTPMYCEVIRCPPLRVPNADPPYGTCTSPSLEYNSRCIFKCSNGYSLIGSKERVCQLDKSWSGTRTSCEEIKCPKLPPVGRGASLFPPQCATGPMRFHSSCQLRCSSGFALSSNRLESQLTLICQVDGRWSQSIPIIPACRDIEPPSFLKCPPYSLETSTSKGKATARVLWSIRVTDNSVDADPNAVINVRSNHESGQELPIGNTDIRITATDQTGNAATCSFGVEVRDTEPPSCSFCPADIIKEVTTSELRVVWKAPICSDNSGVHPFIIPSRHNGQMFKVPGSYIVEYTVRDDAGNENRNCSFKITLKVKSCPRLSPPRNGALVCTTDANPMCAGFCKSGTDFDSSPPLLFYCSAGKWEFYTLPGQGASTPPWPNCSGSANTSWIKMYGFHWYYYNGDAHGPDVQDALRNQFHTLMTQPFVPPFFCTYNPKCTKDSFAVSPGVIG